MYKYRKKDIKTEKMRLIDVVDQVLAMIGEKQWLGWILARIRNRNSFLPFLALYSSKFFHYSKPTYELESIIVLGDVNNWLSKHQSAGVSRVRGLLLRFKFGV